MSATPTETLFGGKKHTVTKKDSTTEEIFIRQIGIEDCPAYLELQDNELAMIEFVCSKPSGWAKSLLPSVQEELIAECDRVNSDFFSRWAERQKSRAERLMPGIVEKRINALSASPTTSPKPPSNAASR